MGLAVVDRPRFRAAFDAPVPALALREVVAEALNGDFRDDRDAVVAALEELRGHFRRIGRPDVEDVILEALDFASGWANPKFLL